ncbi:MAG TPA: SRPBCC family protein [Gemmatimonas sp.]|uniref:SRPBCC family protein n=1 Tax=Gemmatimonas sp. TaxID=1962908 RepID=UPI002EDA1E6C
MTAAPTAAWQHEYTWQLDATPDAIFRALTTADALRHWFAEQVDVGNAVGEPFRFWGRHSLDTPNASSATQRILSWNAGEELAFSWTLHGVLTEVHLTLGPGKKDGATTLRLRHAVSAPLDVPRQRELIDDHWRFVVGNLMAHLSGEADGIVLPDFTDSSPEVRKVMVINAPRATVFRTLIEPELVNQWCGSTNAAIDPRQGGAYAFGWSYEIDGRTVSGGPTRIIEYIENERLTLDWPDWRGDASVNGQTISFVLTDEGDAATRLTFVHTGFDRTADISDYPFGWVWFLSQVDDVSRKQLAS